MGWHDPGMSFVLVDKPHPNVTVVTLNRPDRMNAMAFDVMIPLRDTLHVPAPPPAVGGSAVSGPRAGAGSPGR